MNNPVSILLEKNKNDKNVTLDISNKSLNKIPEELKEFIWIKKLVIKKNAISSIPTSDFPPNITFMDISINRIMKINGSMLTINLVVLEVQNNRIEEFDGKDFKYLKKINLSFNELKEIKSFPPNLIEGDFSFNKIIEITSFPQNMIRCDLSTNRLQTIATKFKKHSKLKFLDVSHNYIKDSDKIMLNNGLIEFDISDNLLDKLPKAPDTLESFIFSHNNICEIDKPLPKSLKKLSGENNKIILFDAIVPININIINLEENRLSEFIDISNTNIISMNLRDNCIQDLPDSNKIPLSLKELDISNNFVSDIPIELKNRDSLIITFGDGNDDISRLFHEDTTTYNSNSNFDFNSDWYNKTKSLTYDSSDWWKINNKQYTKTSHMTYDIPITNTITL